MAALAASAHEQRRLNSKRQNGEASAERGAAPADNKKLHSTVFFCMLGMDWLHKRTNEKGN